MKRIARIVLVSGTIIASLLVFPGSIPWMIFAWLFFYSVALLRGGYGWKPLLACCAIAIVKRSDWPSTLVALISLMAAAALCGAIANAKGASLKPAFKWSSVVVVWMAWGWFSFDYVAAARSSHITQFEGRPVVCLGDSLTSYGYPQELAKRLSVPVIDLSISGCTSADALGLIARMQSAKPQTVIIELGGHDFLKGSPRAATAENLKKIIEAAHAVGADVVLMEIAHGACIDWYSGLERSLARQYDLELISDTPFRKLIMWSPYAPPGMWFDASTHLSDDGLHPNDRGNVFLADWVAARLIRMYGTKIVNQSPDVTQPGK